MHDERDETIERVRAALKPLPPTDAHAVARVLSAVHGRTPQPTPWWREFLDWVRVPSLSVAGASGLVAAALVAGFVIKGQLATSTTRTATTSNVATSSAPAAATPTNAAPTNALIPATADDTERAMPVQFVLDLPDASSVSVVGDFNNWAVDEAPMQKSSTGVWNLTLPVKPGRHEYSFVVDGKRWIADPRAPKANTGDFGKPGSVVVVTTP